MKLIEGVTLIEQVPVYDKFWMPLLIVNAVLTFIFVLILNKILKKSEYWVFCNTRDEGTKSDKFRNDFAVVLWHILAALVAAFITTIIWSVMCSLKADVCINPDKNFYKIEVVEGCDKLEFDATYRVIEQLQNNTYVVEVK